MLKKNSIFLNSL